jgi:hypothetical protein
LPVAVSPASLIQSGAHAFELRMLVLHRRFHPRCAPSFHHRREVPEAASVGFASFVILADWISSNYVEDICNLAALLSEDSVRHP